MGERNWEYTIMRALHLTYGSVILSELELSFLEQNFNSCKMWTCKYGKCDGKKEMYLYILGFPTQSVFLHLRKI